MSSHIKDFCNRIINTAAHKRGMKLTGMWVLSVLLMGMVACADKDLETGEGNASGNYDTEDAGFNFMLHLDNLSATRATATDAIDNYVDIVNKFQVLCFDSKGDFLFEARDITVEPTPDNNGQWYVTIHLRNNMTDYLGNSISLSQVKTQFENDDFKIAVLANWTKLEERSGEVSPFKIQWGWNDSKLNPGVSAPKNINNLHHVDVDDYYWGNTERKNTYSYLMTDDGKLGLKTFWVTSKLNKKERQEMESWIRANWNPTSGNSTLPDYYDTKNASGNLDLWQLWNFGGYYKGGSIVSNCFDTNADVTYPDLNADKFESAWQSRNGKDFYDLFGSIDDGDPVTYDAGSNTNIKGDGNSFSVDGLTYVALSPYTKNNANRVDAKAYHGEGRHGLVLPPTYSYEKDNEGKPYIKTSSQNANGYFTLMAPGTGRLKIKWSGTDPNQNAKLVIQRHSNNEHNPSGSKGYAIQDYDHPISITQDPQEIVIFNAGQADAVIYSIEYICDKYLLDTDREGVPPSQEQPIPMYGVQDYKKIDNWGENKLLNLSQSGRFVNLIRALAKVEVYFPAEGSPEIVFMRSMNRSARCEPMDVSSPTWDAWSKFTGMIIHDAEHCEWFDIQNYGSGYSNSHNGNDFIQDTNYNNWLSYFYGSWNYKWDNVNNKNVAKGATEWQWDFKGAEIPFHTGIIYPRIFNPTIDRSDFCRFINKGIDPVSGMRRFVLYVPDKNIDDPNDAGDLSSTPKVAHIEYRYPRMTHYLDDNDCHRIYFTDYSTNSQIKEVYKDQFDNYEKNQKFLYVDDDDNDFTVYEEHLNKHWPIMRNHIYRFYIGSTNVTEDIRVSVTEFGQHEEPKREEW